MIPTVIHMASEGSLMNRGRYCGHVQKGSWAEKYMDDEVARILPLCLDCLERYAERHGEKARQRVLEYMQKEPTKKVVRAEVALDEDPQVSHSAHETSGEARTLREYLEG